MEADEKKATAGGGCATRAWPYAGFNSGYCCAPAVEGYRPDANHAGGPYQWEMYDLETDPLETRNLAYASYQRTKQQEKEYLRLRRQLAAVTKKRLRPLKRPLN
jgi:hypothetical protein